MKFPHRVRPSHPRAGFSLAEVLLTVLIMSGIMLAITQILQAARISRDTIHIIKETQLAGPAIMDMIERDLRGLVTLNRTRQDHLRVEDRVMLGLDGDSLDFVTQTDSLILRQDGDRSLLSDINEVGYRLRPSPVYDDFLELYRREDLGVDDTPFEGGAFSFLHDRVKSLDIQVFEEDGPDADPLDEWGQQDDERIGLPTRLEVSLTLELKQRVAREQLAMNYARKSMVTYRRVIRLPEALRVEEDEIVILSIPQAPTAASEAGGAAGGEVTGGTIVGGAASGGEVGGLHRTVGGQKGGGGAGSGRDG